MLTKLSEQQLINLFRCFHEDGWEHCIGRKIRITWDKEVELYCRCLNREEPEYDGYCGIEEFRIVYGTITERICEELTDNLGALVIKVNPDEYACDAEEVIVPCNALLLRGAKVMVDSSE